MTNILIVEDNAILRGLLRDLLSAEFPECRVLEAASGEEALELADAVPISLGVMDIGLPGMSGIEAARLLTARYPGFRFVIMSIHEEERYLQEAREAGAYAYVPKRKLQAQLLPVVRELLGAGKYSPVAVEKMTEAHSYKGL